MIWDYNYRVVMTFDKRSKAIFDELVSEGEIK